MHAHTGVIGDLSAADPAKSEVLASRVQSWPLIMCVLASSKTVDFVVL